jgi:hypothetical protein
MFPAREAAVAYWIACRWIRTYTSFPKSKQRAFQGIGLAGRPDPLLCNTAEII